MFFKIQIFDPQKVAIQEATAQAERPQFYLVKER
jgi:hypothetical protein